MDNHGLISITRRLAMTFRQVVEVRKAQRPEWKFAPGVVVMPESLCPFCMKPVRSSGIWVLGNPPLYSTLLGMIEVKPGGRVQLIHPNHPNQMSSVGNGGGFNLCLGTHKTGFSLLGAPANLKDCHINFGKLPAWYATYWNHPPCKEGQEWMIREKAAHVERVRSYNDRNGYPLDRHVAATEELYEP